MSTRDQGATSPHLTSPILTPRRSQNSATMPLGGQGQQTSRLAWTALLASAILYLEPINSDKDFDGVKKANSTFSILSSAEYGVLMSFAMLNHSEHILNVK